MRRIKLTESDLMNIVKRVLREQDGPVVGAKMCSTEALQSGGNLYSDGTNIMLSYETEGANSTCMIGPAKGARVKGIMM